jgi:hypothetical protein
MDALTQFFEVHREWLLLLSVLSVLMLVASVLLVPWLIIRAPQDVFVREVPAQRGPLALLVMLLRNLLGALLFVAGLLMLVLPGQGVITLVVALCLADVPRKRALLRRIVARRAVWRSLAWIRAKAGVPPFEAP